jgi:iron uptake system EfeUOB component EfeO/EfeM
MKWAQKLAAFALVGSLTLTGCSLHQGAASHSAKDQQKTQTAQNETKQSSTDIKTGAIHMLSLTNELKKQIDAGNATKIKMIGPQLEDIWHSFEEGVKPKYPDIYADVEKNLDPLVAGCQASSFDKKTLAKLNDQLAQALDKLVQKVK